MLNQNTQDLVPNMQALIPWIVTNGLNVMGAIAILLVGVWLAGKVHNIVVRTLSRAPHSDEMLQSFFGRLARYLVLTTAVLAALSKFGIQTTSFVAVLGAASLAVGLALQGALSNLAAGVMLLIFRPFRIGHKVQVGGMTGTVKELSLFWTELVTDDKIQIIVPNGSVWGQPLRNFSRYPAVPPVAEVRFPLPETSKLDAILPKVWAVVGTQPRIRKDPAPTVLLDHSGTDNALEIVVGFSAAEEEMASAKSELIASVHNALEITLARRVA